LTEANKRKRKVLAVLLGDRGSRWRCLLVWATGSSALGTLILLVLPAAGRLWSARDEVGALPVDVALVGVSAGVVLGCACWAWLVLTVIVAEAWRGVRADRGRRRRVPAGVRRLVLGACGVALAAGVTSPTYAEGGSGTPHGVALLSGLPLPDRAVAPHGRAHPGPPSRTVTVRPGDSLWSIAEDDLPAGATTQAIARRWRAVYDANRRLVGPDPDSLIPGQQLRLPRKDRS
jgi:hypothetical protein